MPVIANIAASRPMMPSAAGAARAGNTRQILVDGNQAAVELYARATSKAGVQFHNDYCWVCRFEDETIVEVRAYLDSALVAKVIQRGD